MTEPRYTPTNEANIPDDLSGDGAMATQLAAAYFGAPVPWQPHILDIMLARDGRDKYRVRTMGLSVPRQNGKSWVVRARCFYGALNGEKILYTCHHGDTSDQMFMELSRPFEDEENVELHELLKAVRKTNGKQAIYLKNGGLIRFSTRTDSMARGKTFDVIVYDEAQELTYSQQSASLCAISAGAKHNPQTIYLGTPPRPESIGTVFKDLRTSVHDKKSNAVWVEWAADKVYDAHDKAKWFEYNPALGALVDIAAVEGEADQMKPIDFAIERLGYWKMTEGNKTLALDADAWTKCQRDTAMNDGKLAFGVKFSPDGSVAAVSWARAKRGSGSYVELWDILSARGGTAYISDMLMRNRGEISAVCIDGKSGADALIQRLYDNRFPKKAIISGTSAIVQAAATMLKDEVDSGTLTHIASPALDESAIKSIKRDVGNNGGWGFGDGINSIATPIESAMLALYAARTTKRDPRRQQEASF